MRQVKPFLRWAGGKSWLVPYVKDLIDGLEFNDYYEPFMGGASIFFAIETPNMSYLSDINEELVNAYISIKEDPQKVIETLKDMKSDEVTYYKIRESLPKEKFKRAARFVYLNFYSYNGLYRVNKEGKYNVPYGRRKAEINYERLEIVRNKLKNTEISCQDFDHIRRTLRERDLVFLDPPYSVGKEKEMFIAYNSTLFSIEDQIRLSDLIDDIEQRGAYFIMTNAAHGRIEEIFQGKGRMIPITRKSVIGGKNAYRGEVEEYIFTNVPRKE